MKPTAVAIVAALLTSAQEPRRSVALADLTVPPASLPAGCALAPERGDPVKTDSPRTAMGTGLSVPSNPWLGTDRQLLAQIRGAMDGPLKLPDAPPLSSKEIVRMQLQLADGVEEGYAAIYRHSETGPTTIVRALRFADAPVPASYRPTANARVVRMSNGNVRALVTGDGGECFKAVAAHVAAFSR